MNDRLKRWGSRAAIALLALGVPAGISQAADDPAGVINCELNGFVVKDPTLISGGGTNGDGHFGAASIAGATVNSQVECAGNIIGTAGVSGSFNWCPNTHGSGTFNCNGATGSHTGPDELLYPSVVPTNVHVIGKGKLSSSGAVVPLQRVSDGQVFTECTFDFEGHALAPPTLHVNLRCGTERYTGEATTTFVPVLGNDAGNLFQSPGHNHPLCGAAGQPTGPQCFRAVIFTGDIELRKLPI